MTETGEQTVARLADEGRIGTVREALGDAPAAPVRPFTPPVLEGTPDLPEPGIYFGMSDEDYHALPALSNSGIKKLSASPMIFWAGTPWLSPKKQKQVAEAAADEKAHHVFGKAYHCRLMEGASAYAMRYAIELTPEDCGDCLESTAQIKAAIASHLVPSTAKKSEGELVPAKPWSKVEDFMPGTGEAYQRPAVKADWIKQLLELEPDAPVFDAMQQAHKAQHAGKTFLTADQHLELEIAAAMIERDPEAKKVFVGGHAEVTLIWYCPKTGVPMKARVDYLKLDGMVDLKSIANQRELSIENALRFAIGSYKYNIQPVVYFEGAEEVRRLVRESGGGCVFQCDAPGGLVGGELVSWAIEWSKYQGKDDWTWIFQQKGEAPITRGVHFSPESNVAEETRYIVERAKKRFLQHCEVFGTEPWLDIAPFYTIADEDIPRSATEL